jgi:hypothetical protein
VTVLKELANRLGKTRIGQRALEQPDGLGFLKEKPTPRFYFGLALIILSYAVSLPAFALVGYLAVYWDNPWIAVIGVPAVFILVHLIFVLGVFLAGGNYAKNTFLWACRHFLLKFGGKEPTGNYGG